MKLENAEAQMRKGILELCILSIIAEGEVYPSDIIGKLTDAKMLVKQGTLYPLLTRLKNSGLLAYTWKESTSGPPRKYFHITEEGKQFLNGLLDTWKQLEHAVSESTKNYQPHE